VLVEAALTLGTKNAKLVTRVVILGILPDLYRDQRILLGWAWTYPIVAELIGTTSGICWFITVQARYQHFANVYAVIIIIGVIGVGTDVFLVLLGRRLFPWEHTLAKNGRAGWIRSFPRLLRTSSRAPGCVHGSIA
jgi:NitT/TauT family transport system permease protein